MSFLELTCGASFVVEYFSVHEAVSEPFRISIQAGATDANVDLGAVVGKPASLRVSTGYAQVQGCTRTFSGICNFA